MTKWTFDCDGGSAANPEPKVSGKARELADKLLSDYHTTAKQGAAIIQAELRELLEAGRNLKRPRKTTWRTWAITTGKENMDKNEFLRQMKTAAMNIGASWPGYWAAEAALETGFGSSRLFTQGNNVFGRKQSVLSAVYDTLELPTREYMNGEWITVNAAWVKYPDLDACFRDRLALLNRLSGKYPHYARALAAGDGETFVREVSKTWSTDPERADKVLDIYNQHVDVLG